VTASRRNACLGSEARIASRTGQIVSIEAYLREAQAYMLISMPTDTSTIFGAFQAIPTSSDFGRAIAPQERRTSMDVTQVFAEKVMLRLSN
jgi:hypothetical protein